MLTNGSTPRCIFQGDKHGRLVKGGESVNGRGGRANQPKFWPKVDGFEWW